MNAPIRLVVAAFKDDQAADAAKEVLWQAQQKGLIGVIDAALVKRDDHNKLHIKETADAGAGRGSLIGGTFGGLLGLIAGGPVGWAVGLAAGAATGGVTGKLVDAGIPDARLKELGEAIPAGASAIVAIVEQQWVADLEAMLVRAGAQIKMEVLKEDIAQQLREKK